MRINYPHWSKKRWLLYSVSTLIGIILIASIIEAAVNPNKQSSPSSINTQVAQSTVVKKAQTATQAVTYTQAQTQPVAPPKPAPAPPPAPPPAQPIIGFGATIADWNANHVADTRFNTNAVYNPDPSLGYDELHDSKYYMVQVQNGQVLGYEMRLPNGSSLSAAQAEIMQEFPPDASILWQQARTSDPSDSCYQMEIKSSRLGQALSEPAIGDAAGEVWVELFTDTPQNVNENSVYDGSNVNGANLMLGSYATAADAPGC